MEYNLNVVLSFIPIRNRNESRRAAVSDPFVKLSNQNVNVCVCTCICVFVCIPYFRELENEYYLAWMVLHIFFLLSKCWTHFACHSSFYFFPFWRICQGSNNTTKAFDIASTMLGKNITKKGKKAIHKHGKYLFFMSNEHGHFSTF